jgi:hypothetical protein
MDLMLKKKITIMLIGFLNGLNDLNILLMFYYYKEILLLPIISLQMVQSLMIFPWLLKPVVGFISDNYPIWGSRRRNYITIINLLEFVFFICLSTLPRNIFLVAALNLSIIVCIVFCNVIAEALTVELTQEIRKKGLPTKKFINSESKSDKRAKTKSLRSRPSKRTRTK